MNEKGIWKKVGFGLIAVVALALGPEESAQGGSLKKNIDLVVAMNTAAAKAQAQIDKIDDKSSQLITQYRDLERQRESLRVYNEQIEKLVVAQRAKMERIQQEINDAAMIGRELTPLMFRMLDNLEQFIKLDIPFMLDKRMETVAELREVMNNSEIEDSDKFQQILTAYTDELEYGKFIDEYKGKLNLGGQETEVEFLMIGRLVLVYRSIDGAKLGIWNQEKKKWDDLSREYFAAIQKGFRIARKQAAPGLIHLPVLAPKTAGGAQ